MVSITKDGHGGVLISGDVKDLAVVRIEPHHTLVLRCTGTQIGPQHVQELTDAMKRFFPDNMVLVLLPGMELSVVDGKR